MDLRAIKKLLLSERPSDDYIAGVEGFLKFAYREKKPDVKIRCPCHNCVNRMLQKMDTVYDHLLCNRMLRGYTIWGCHGETASYIAATKDSESQLPNLNNNMRQVLQEAFGYADHGLNTNEPDVAVLLKLDQMQIHKLSLICLQMLINLYGKVVNYQN